MSNLMELFERLESQNISVHQNRCVAVRNRNASCMRCAEACTSGCISYDDNTIIIAPEKCVGCGTCATVCPTCAIEAHKPGDAELLRDCIDAMNAADGEVVIACERMLGAASGLYDPTKVVSVTCLGRVEESLLVTLAEMGAKRLTLVQGDCEGCELVLGLETAELVRDTANVLLETWNSPVRVRITAKLPGFVRKGDDAEFDAARREFFTSMKEEATSVASIVAEESINDALKIERKEPPKYLKVMEDGTLPHFIPDRRERLLDALAALGEPQDVMIDTRLWGHVVIDPEKCTSCQMCATFCPTGAIRKWQGEDGTFGVDHYPGDCVKCRCCEDICRTNALWLSDEVFAVDLLSGAVDRYEMAPLKNPPSNPHSILHSMKDLIGISQIYER
ncbi:MAG: 4Fe-4S binding protein [Eggerthellaceae bacterium]|nr:4Fe-4S binding protein [Eggerthellaceae bacterium]